MKFKIGDRVKINESCHFEQTGKITQLYSGTAEVLVDGGTGDPAEHSGPFEYLGLIQSTMNIKEKFVLALTTEPKKSFRKAEITNGDDLLTDEGQKIFLTWLRHTKYADEFQKEVVDGLLEDKAA